MVTIFVIVTLIAVGLGVFKVGAFFVGVSEERSTKRTRDARIDKAHERIDAEATKFSTPEEIREFFKNKQNVIVFGHKVNRGRDSGLQGMILSRALSTMSQREAEALYYSELLGLRGYIRENDAHYIRGQMIYNGGNCDKVIFDVWLHQLVERKEHQLMDGWMDKGTVATGITKLLNAVAQIPEDRKEDPLVREFRARIIAGNSWSDEDTLLSSPAFAEQDDTGLFIGATEAGKRIVYKGEGSLITIAPTGSGKTQCNVLPTLLSYKGAAIVLDVKGECFERTARWREKEVGPVLKFNPLDPKSARYNPLAVIENDPDTLWEECLLVAELLIVPGSHKEPFWEESARELVAGIIAWIVRQRPPSQRKMSIVVDTLSRIRWDFFIAGARDEREVGGLRRVGETYAEMESKQLDGILQSAKQHLKVWQGNRTERVTAACDWTPDVLRDGGTTIYLSIPLDWIEHYAPLLRVMLTQHLRRLCHGDLPPRDVKPILFMLDELPRLGLMRPVFEALATGRAYGIRLWMFAQNLSDLKECFANPDGAVANCAARIYMSPDPQDGTAKRVSEELGEVESIIDKSRHPMVRPEQLSGPEYRDVQIMIHRNMRPAKLTKIFTWQDPVFAERMKADALAPV